MSIKPSRMRTALVVFTGMAVSSAIIRSSTTSRLALSWVYKSQAGSQQEQEHISAPQPHPPQSHLHLANGSIEQPPPTPAIPPVTLIRPFKLDSVSTLSFSPNGKILAIARDSLQLWEVATGQLQTTLEDKRLPVVPKAFFSPKEALVAAFSYDDSAGDEVENTQSALVLWNIQAKKVVRMLHNRNSKADWKDATFSHNGELLATTEGTEHGTYNSLRLWDVHSGKLVKTLSDIEVEKVAFSPEGKTLAGGAVNYVRLWDVQSGKIVKSFHHPGGVSSLAFSRDGSTLATISKNKETTGGAVKVWNVRTEQLIHTLKVDWCDTLSVLFTPDGKTLLIGGGRLPNEDTKSKLLEQGTGMILFYDVQAGTLKSLLKLPDSGEVEAMALSPDGQTLATGEYGSSAKGKAVKLWRLK